MADKEEEKQDIIKKVEVTSTLVEGQNKEEIKELGEGEVKLTTEWVMSKISEAKDDVLKKAKEEISTQVQTDKASLITVFGIFASVISFLTIEFQFLKTLCSLEKILGFSLILFALLFGFNVALDYLVKSRLDKKTPVPNIYFSVMILLLFVVGVLFSFKGNEEICKDRQIYQKYSDQFETNFQVKSKVIDNRLNNQDDKIKNIETIIDSLKTKGQ